jgi:hypothetical protein
MLLLTLSAVLPLQVRPPQFHRVEILSPRPAGQYGAVALNMRGQLAVQTDSAAFLSLRGRWQQLPEPKHRYGYRQILSLSDDGTVFMTSSQMNDVGATASAVYSRAHFRRLTWRPLNWTPVPAEWHCKAMNPVLGRLLT